MPKKILQGKQVPPRFIEIINPIIMIMVSTKFHLFYLLPFFLFATVKQAKAQENMFNEWKTELEKHSIELEELMHGGLPKDGIPSIDNPVFISPMQAADWLGNREPVIAVKINNEARAYPVQILMWHEIVNDWFGDQPVTVTFCPLCYSALVFDRRVKEDVLEFGVSGFLRHSDLVMFDRSTESLWQQITGEAIVGSYTGTVLDQVLSQIISFEQFREVFPEGEVLSKETGFNREYGSNPYAGYDDIEKNPMLMDEADLDGRLRPMEKVIGVDINGHRKGYPYLLTKEAGVINDIVDDRPIVIFHVEGASSALDAPQIDQSREDGSTGVFQRLADGRKLQFIFDNGRIQDEETGSYWNIAGQAVEGPLKGTRLQPVHSGDYFAFAWLVFFPDTDIYK